MFVFTTDAQDFRQIELRKESGSVNGNSFSEVIKLNTKSTYLNETFKNLDNWTITDGGETSDTWHIATPEPSSLDGTPYAIVVSDDAGQLDMDEIMELTVGIDVTDATSLFFSFDHFMWDWDTNPTPTQGLVQVWDGNEWVTVYTADNQDIGSWDVPDHQDIEITAYKNDELKVRFHYTANWDFWWAVDNCIIYSKSDHDLGMLSKSLEWLFVDDSKIPTADVYNFGIINENTYSVNYIIYNDEDEVIYDETVNVENMIAPDATATISFPAWTGTIAGTYKDTVIVTVFDDGNSFNNKIGGEIKVIGDVEYDAGTIYGWNGDPTAYTTKISLETGELNNMQATGDLMYWTCASYINGRVYGVNFNNIQYTNAKLYYLNNDGTPYEIGSIEGSYMISAMAHDITTGKTYITNFSNIGVFELFELDIENLTTTYIGAWGSTANPGVGNVFALACDNNGALYGLAGIINQSTYVVDDAKLITFDKNTAEITEVGEIDVDIVFGNHDLSFDRQTNILYGTLLEQADGAGVYSFNTENGEATLIHDLNLEYPITACAIIPSSLVNINQEENTIINIYPNPSNGVFNIDFKTFTEVLNVSITDITGKIIYQLANANCKSQIQIDLSNQNKGIYFIRLFNNSSSYNYKININ